MVIQSQYFEHIYYLGEYERIDWKYFKNLALAVNDTVIINKEDSATRGTAHFIDPEQLRANYHEMNKLGPNGTFFLYTDEMIRNLTLYFPKDVDHALLVKRLTTPPKHDFEYPTPDDIIITAEMIKKLTDWE
jgi:hypothetical protein